ncbi:hypothetical protein L484_008079 [Morus notabilis]|uniref:Uncharacterized protein n=1 Tax=Morus notabilis TaxID=981085 RepID=W9RRH3_9ROSA|nr:hypothetical protein L484_008079 [Morus notabilis]
MATLQSSTHSSSASLKEIKCTLHSQKVQSSNLFVPKILVHRRNELLPILRTTSTDVNLKSKIKFKPQMILITKFLAQK